MQVSAYLNFDGRTEEALEFYKKAIGAEVTAMMRFADSPAAEAEGHTPPGAEKKVMHSAFNIGSTMVMASDCHCAGQAKFEGFSLALNPKTVAEAEKVFKALSDGGTVEMPLGKTFWTPAFGTLKDRFGVSWMVSVMEEPK